METLDWTEFAGYTSLVLVSSFAFAGEVKSFKLAGLKLIPTPWDRAANLPNWRSTPARLQLPELISLSPQKATLRGTSVTTS